MSLQKCRTRSGSLFLLYLAMERKMVCIYYMTMKPDLTKLRSIDSLRRRDVETYKVQHKETF